jgi:hypothetical protein
MHAIAQEVESSIVEQESYTRKWWKKSTDAMAYICNGLVRPANDHKFGSLLMLAVTAGGISAGNVGRDKGAFLLPPAVVNSLKATSSDGPSISSQQAGSALELC